MRVIRNPVAQFLLAGSLTFAAIVALTGYLSGRAAAWEAVSDARATTRVLARSVAEPALPRGLVAGDAGAIDRFDREVLRRLLVGNVRRIKIWDADGTIVYSDETELIGSRFELDPEELSILRGGGVDAGVSDLSDPENRLERASGGLVEVYTRIRAPEGDPLLFEAYYSAADIEARKQEVFQPFRRITVVGLLLLLGVATPMLWVLTRRLTRAAAERERLLRTAVEASEAERRRIARDLHDGVVQDLAGTAFAVSALARAKSTGTPAREALEEAAASLRTSLRALRSLLVEIHPPGLSAEGLAPALEDLTAPATAAGVHAAVSVDGVQDASDATVALVWRVAQEAVRNAIRHAQASTLDVVVRSGAGGRIVLEVHDDGVGLTREPDPSSFGLRGLCSLVADAGGSLQVTSAPGRGTTVLMEVDSR